MGDQREREIVLSRVAANLRTARRRLDVSQETLGILAGLHRAEIGTLENAERIPRIDTIVKLATVLEIPVQLVDGLTWEPPERVGEAGRFVAAAVGPLPVPREVLARPSPKPTRRRMAPSPRTRSPASQLHPRAAPEGDRAG